MKKLRLLITEVCNRNCKGCCNKYWDLKSIPQSQLSEAHTFSEIMFTGGEPLLKPELTDQLATCIKSLMHPQARLYIYTAEPTAIQPDNFSVVDGFTITLHEQEDVQPFIDWCITILPQIDRSRGRRWRLNVFDTVKIPRFIRATLVDMGWLVKDMKWVVDCPLPDNEVFERQIIF